jgi:chromosome segregation ATPase
MSLSEQAWTGLRDMPSNAAWLLSRALKPAEAVGSAADSAITEARDQARRAGATMVDVVPLGGDSVEIRMRRAEEAGERAREAEQRALDAAREAKARSDYARDVSERGQARLKECERQLTREVKQRLADAQREADEAVRHEQQAAAADAHERQLALKAEVDDENENAQQEAEQSQQRAEELVEDANEKLTQARRLADEAAAAARHAAEAANRQAQRLAAEAQREASDAEARAGASERLREQSQSTAKHAARGLQSGATDGPLESYTKPDLVELAANIGIEHRTTMTKRELVDAIAKASRTSERRRSK